MRLSKLERKLNKLWQKFQKAKGERKWKLFLKLRKVYAEYVEERGNYWAVFR